MKTILVLTDFSTRANGAAEFALQIAIKVEANLVLYHVMEIVETAPMAEQLAWPIADHISLKHDTLSELKALAKKLKQLIPEHATETGFKPTITCTTDFGKLSLLSAEIVKERKITLAVLGSHKSNGITRFLFGSHTHTVLDTINCPVLLVPEGLHYSKINIIAYATDLTFSNNNVIDYLAAIAQPFDADILVSHITGKDLSVALEQTKAEAKASNKYNKKVFYKTIKGDNVTKCLLEAYGDGKADVLALVHKRYGFFNGLFHSSVSKKIASVATIPLLILPYCFSTDNAGVTNQQLDMYCYERRKSR